MRSKINGQQNIPLIEPCMVQFCEFPVGFVYPPEKHDYYELVYMDKGQSKSYLDGKEFVSSAGEFMIYPPYAEHGIVTPLTMAVSSCCIGFRIRNDVKIPDELCKRVLTLSPEQQRCIANIYPMATETEWGGWAVSCEIGRLLISMMKKVATRGPLLPATEDERINDVVNYISDNPGAVNTIEELASRFGIGRTVLCRDFHRATGMTIHEAVDRARLRTAKEEIRSFRRSFTDIGAEVGMPDVHYFSAWFRRQTGMTPSEYKKRVEKYVKKWFLPIPFWEAICYNIRTNLGGK